MSEWKTVKIGEICEQINGVSYKPADVYDSLTEKATILLRANNIFEDKLNYDELVFVDKKRISENQYMKKGDILICASSGSKHLVGKAACLTEDKDLTFGAFCKVLRPKTVNPEYIKHYFFSPSYRTEISRLSEGANINNIKAADLDNLKIPLPSESIQNKIAKRLDKCVKIINNQRKALEKYDILIKSRFIEMFGDLDCNIKTIEQTCTMKSGTTFSKDEENDSGEIFYIKVSGMNLPENDKYIKTSLSFVSRKVAGKTIIPANSIIFPKRGGAIGTNKKRITEQEICIDLNTMAVTPSNELNIQYLYQYFQNLDMGKLYNGSTVPQINNKDIGPLKIKVPPLELQQQFATFVQQIDKSKFAVQKSLEKTETLYKSLMQRYFA